MNQMGSPTPQMLAGTAAGGLAGQPPLHGMQQPFGEEPPEFIEYWRAIGLRKWSILAFTLLVAAVATFVVFQMKPVYRSTATVLIEANRAKVVQVEDVYSGVSANREHFQTQAEVLKSRDVAQRVVRKLSLASHPEFDPRQQKPSMVQTWIAEIVPGAAEYLVPPVSTDEEAIESRILGRFAGRLSVEPVRLSQLVKVNFEANDPNLAASVANAIAEAYVLADMENRSKITQNAGQWINERMNELKAKLDQSERALQTYREREGMLDSKSMALSGTGRQFEELTQKLVEARVRRSEAEEAYNQIKSGEATNYESVPAVVRHLGVQRAKELEAEAEKKLADVSQRYGPDHPKYSSAESELNSARASTKKQVQAVIASVFKEYNAARATERTIEDALAQSKGQIQNLNRKEIQLSVLDREAATNRQLYQTFLSRFKETNATSDVQQPLARVVDRAVPALTPVRPLKLQSVSIAAVAGLLLGLIGAIALKRLDNTVKTSEDVELRLRQPFLAALPVLKGRAKNQAGRVVLAYVNEPYAEGIRTVSTGVLLSALDSPKKIVGVTSSVPGEGKSTFAINFALSQAKTKKVVLVEADMRRPSFQQVMNLHESQIGLSELVSGANGLEDVLLQIDGTPLHVISSGRIPPNPLELIVSQRFRDVLAQLHERYEMVVIDCPPVQAVSDALMIGTLCTGLVYMVKADDTPLPLAKKGLKRIAAAGLPLFGVVLNQQDFKRAERYYGEYSGYGKYGYGRYGYGKSPNPTA
jgi:capsular exopolysaccharide synthesis family protein